MKMESVMVLDELTTAAEVWARCREVERRKRAQYLERKVMPDTELHTAPPVEQIELATVSAGEPARTPAMPAKIVFPQRPEYVVMRIVAARYGVSQDALKSVRRYQPLVSYRQRAMWITRMLFGKTRSTPRIARAFGNRDHTTLLHAVRSVEAKRALDPELRAELDGLLEECRTCVLSSGERVK